jgi:hypothetical protein
MRCLSMEALITVADSRLLPSLQSTTSSREYPSLHLPQAKPSIKVLYFSPTHRQALTGTSDDQCSHEFSNNETQRHAFSLSQRRKCSSTV